MRNVETRVGEKKIPVAGKVHLKVFSGSWHREVDGKRLGCNFGAVGIFFWPGRVWILLAREFLGREFLPREFLVGRKSLGRKSLGRKSLGKKWKLESGRKK